MMRVVPFSISRSAQEAFRIQVDDMPFLYNHLHQHPELQVTLVLKSEGTLLAGDYVGRFAAGDVFIIGSGQPHVFRSDERYFNGDGRSLAISLFFDDSTLGEHFWQLPELTTFRHFLHHSYGGFRIVGDKREALAQKLEAIAGGSGIDKLILFLEILKLLSDEKEMQPLSKQLFQPTIKTFDGGRLNKVLEFTFREYHRAIRLEEAAAMANLTVEAFCKYFKTRTRKTYINFLNEIRINNACRLLSGSDEPVAGVCFSVGFNNLSNFNRLFKKINDLTPLEYRKKHQLLD